MARKSLASVASVYVLGSLLGDLAVTTSFAVHRSAYMGLKVSRIQARKCCWRYFVTRSLGDC